MDDMSWGDVTIALRYLEFAEVTDWMRTRELMLSVLSPYLKKKDTTAKDILKLPIDDDGIEHTTEISNDEVTWYKNYVEHYKAQHQNNQ